MGRRFWTWAFLGAMALMLAGCSAWKGGALGGLKGMSAPILGEDGPAPSTDSIVIAALTPQPRNGAKEPIPAADVFQPYPAANLMVKVPEQRVAVRKFTVQLQPVSKYALSSISLSLDPKVMKQNLGSLPQNYKEPIVPAGSSVPLDANASTEIALHLPPIGYNHVDLTIISNENPALRTQARFVVPVVVVLDAGHGGAVKLDGSSPNNAEGISSKALEKNLALDYILATGAALKKQAAERNLPVRIVTTRDTDDNVSGYFRAGVAKDEGADRFLVIHFNAGGGRGTEHVYRTRFDGNLNLSEDNAYAGRVVDAVVGVIGKFDSKAKRREDYPKGTTLSNDSLMGNKERDHPVRHAYLEVEFLDTLASDRLLTGDKAAEVRQEVAGAIAKATLDDAIQDRDYSNRDS